MKVISNNRWFKNGIIALYAKQSIDIQNKLKYITLVHMYSCEEIHTLCIEVARKYRLALDNNEEQIVLATDLPFFLNNSVLKWSVVDSRGHPSGIFSALVECCRSKRTERDFINLLRKSVITNMMTWREMHVAYILVRGGSIHEIAKELCVTTKTVYSYLASLRAKTNIRTTAGLVIHLCNLDVMNSMSDINYNLNDFDVKKIHKFRIGEDTYSSTQYSSVITNDEVLLRFPTWLRTVSRLRKS